MDRARRPPLSPQYHERAQMFHFGGNDSRRPGDSYRPTNSTEFSYRHVRDSGPKFPGINPDLPRDSRLPINSRHARGYRVLRESRQPKHSQDHRQLPNRGRGSNRARPATNGFRAKKTPTSDRPLLVIPRSTTPEQFSGMNTEGESRFNLAADDDPDNINAISSSDEQPRSKRAKVFSAKDTTEDATSTPKWSNPDPYTALPPVDDAKRKKKDVVELIRNARITVAADATSDRSANEADFISFDNEIAYGTGSSEDNELPSWTSSQAPSISNRPKVGLKEASNSHLISLLPGTDRLATPASVLGPPPSGSMPPLPSLSNRVTTFGADDKPITDAVKALQDLAGVEEPRLSGKNKKRKRELQGDVVHEWQAVSGVNATPWCTIDHSMTARSGVRLHKEICDFYEYARPREFENELRHQLVSRVARFLNAHYKFCQVRYFGSFAAGLYLPNADMDLVVLSDDFVQSGKPALPTQGGALRKFLIKFANQLQASRVARHGSTLAIFKAKVPIVKYIDQITGLRVDISFENATGPTANKTYQRWKAEFPAMPIIVTLVKQFLMMRGLNEVHTGGLGGFSVTCLVVSLLQNLPHIQSGSVDPMQNLGEIFMDFLDFYGNKFNCTTTGIQFDPPRFFPKHLERRVVYRPNKAWSLSIIDPNRPDNDISSGSTNVVAIFKAFSSAFDTLQHHMNDIDKGIERSGSLLGPLYRGNYHSFERQRAHLESLYTKDS